VRFAVNVVSLLVAFLAIAPLGQTDTIHLKNGQTIYADRAVEKNGHIEYDIGEEHFAIPKAAVDHIESSAAPVHSAGVPEVALTPPTEDFSRSAEVQDRLIHDGHVDPAALASVEQIGSNQLTAAAYFVAGRFEYTSGDAERARQYFERGLGYAPQDPAMLIYYTATLLRLHRTQDALHYAQESTRVAPSSSDAFKLLGQAYFDSDKTPDAIKAWKRSLELQPDGNVKELLAMAERESSAESNFAEADTGHFNFHYDGATTPELRRQIMETLEGHYNSLAGELGVTPRETISVSLYTSQEFFDVTQAPGWAGALYDGKLRIPVSGLTAMTPELSRVLKHELTHSFIRDITHGRCPQWLNEGVAQAMEGKTISPVAGRLERVYAAQAQMPLASLEGNWNSFSPPEAQLAYYEGLGAVEYLNDTYGMSDIVRMMQRLGEGASTEVALRSTIHGGYADLEQGIADYLKRHYGN
jgi:tetratricopeptide (TPR) repeat protein